MSQTIVINVPHDLGKAEAKRRIQEGFGSMDQLQASGMPGVVSFEKRWDGDCLALKAGGLGQTISTKLEILDHSVQITIDVPRFLAARGFHQSRRSERNGQGPRSIEVGVVLRIGSARIVSVRACGPGLRGGVIGLVNVVRPHYCLPLDTTRSAITKT